MSSLKVAVRVRPFNSREIGMESESIVKMEENKTRLCRPTSKALREVSRDGQHEFTFDYSYWSFDDSDKQFATQEQVYQDLGLDVVNSAYEGYNACVFAYGQTGSGKTYTMMGSPDNPGLIPRICEQLFVRMRIGQESGTVYKTNASYLEIYNEKVKDLLGPQSSGHGLRVREHKDAGPYVENLTKKQVSNYEQIQECITRGNLHRTTASTKMNDTSSRSHAIFTITFIQAVFLNNMPSETISKIHLVDLAGSERANATGATGQRLKEGAHINKSLVTLGSVISALAELASDGNTTRRTIHVPYRDSVLTWLLKDSLGGNSKTIMIAAISPADCNYSETLSTLRYANRAKNIINKPTINEDPNVKLIRELREEINALKSMLAGEAESVKPHLKVLEDLQKKEAQEKVLTEEWTEKWKIAQSILQEVRSLGLRKSGVGVVLDSEMPHLIGIHNDVRTGVTLYSLKEGETRIGSAKATDAQDIELSGDDIRPEHCRVFLKNGVATLYPCDLAQCWVNARLIDEPKQISQGDIILLGRTNIFRFNNPAEMAAAHFQEEMNSSQIDLSRLSFITSSRENLSSSFCSEDSMNGSFSLQSFRRGNDTQQARLRPMFEQHPVFQTEHRKILGVIENALKQLDIERVHMRNQYTSKLNKLTNELQKLEQDNCDRLRYLDCQEQELQARKDMLAWEKNNEKVQIEIVSREISALQTQLDFSEGAAEEFVEDNNTNFTTEVSAATSEELVSKLSNSLESVPLQVAKEQVKQEHKALNALVKGIAEKKVILHDSAERIAKIDKRMLELQASLEQLRLERTKVITATKVYDHAGSAVTTTSQTENKSTRHSGHSTLPTENSQSVENNQIAVESVPSETLSTSDNDICQAEEESSFSPPMGGAASSIGGSLTASTHAHMSDSGVFLESRMPPHQPNNSCQLMPLYSGSFYSLQASDGRSASCSSCENGRNSDLPRRYCQMHALRREIAGQKALIMKNLELGVNKTLLDNQIVELQELQRRYIELEKAKVEETNGNRVAFEHRFEEVEVASYASECVSHQYVLDNLEHFIAVPNFLLRGAGKHTHFEYEISISLPDGKLNVLRRYSRFRQLHLDMKNTYGAKVAALTFPRRELFSAKSESVARNRRQLLERYLRDLLKVCANIPQSPVFADTSGPGLTCDSLAKLSPFFRKGLFENGKHGTG